MPFLENGRYTHESGGNSVTTEIKYLLGSEADDYNEEIYSINWIINNRGVEIKFSNKIHICMIDYDVVCINCMERNEKEIFGTNRHLSFVMKRNGTFNILSGDDVKFSITMSENIFELMTKCLSDISKEI